MPMLLCHVSSFWRHIADSHSPMRSSGNTYAYSETGLRHIGNRRDGRRETLCRAETHSPCASISTTALVPKRYHFRSGIVRSDAVSPEDLPAFLNPVSRTLPRQDRTNIIHKISATKPWTPSPILILEDKADSPSLTSASSLSSSNLQNYSPPPTSTARGFLFR